MVIISILPRLFLITFPDCLNPIISRQLTEGVSVMKRRTFIKSAGALGAAAGMPVMFSNDSLIKQAAAVPLLNEVDFVAPQVMPQVINIFLCGIL